MGQTLEPSGVAQAVTVSSISRRTANSNFWLLWIANFINYADRYAFLALGIYIQPEFKLTDFEYGLLSTSFLLVYTLSIFPLGLLADRIKRKNVVAGGITFWSLVTAFTAFSPNFASLFATRAALGLGEGGYFPASTSMLASAYPKNKRASIMSRWNTGLLAGLAFGYIGAGILYGVFNNQWRPVFYFFAIPGLILALFIFLLKELPRHADGDDTNIEAAIAREGLAGVWRNITELWRIKTLRVVVALQALSFFVYGVTLVFITPLFGRLYPNFTVVSPLTLVGVGTVIGGIIGLLSGGAISDRLIKRYPGSRVLVSGWSFLISAPFFAISISVLILPMAVADNVRILGIFLPLYIITVALLQVNSGPLTAVSQDVVTPLKRATSIGLTLLLSHFLGDLFSPSIAGYLSDILQNHSLLGFYITHANSPGFAFLITCVPILFVAGVVGIWGARFVKQDEEAAHVSV